MFTEPNFSCDAKQQVVLTSCPTPNDHEPPSVKKRVQAKQEVRYERSLKKGGITRLERAEEIV
jgi:hypothetical protein